TATTILIELLRAFGWAVSYYLPRRLEEGYGLSPEAAANCLEKFPVALILAVDCGSTAVEAIDWLQSKGVDVVVLDHHQVSQPPPRARALVNPQLAPPDVPSFRELCSAGLAFKLAHALLKRGRQTGLPGAEEFDLREFLELVAMGTIADLVPLTGENRVFVSAGLERLNQTRRPGLVALRGMAQIHHDIGVYEVGFQFSPRLNAAGRLETAEEALELLLAKTITEAEPRARNLDARNRERQQIERSISDDVIAAVRARFKPETDYVIVEGQMLWHIGVVGIVASRVLREFYRPTIILGGEADSWRGSGRSVEGFDLAAALRHCDDLLLRHGGHALAAGLTIHPDKLDAFRERINQYARQNLHPDHLKPSLRLDAEVGLGDLPMERLAELEQLKPTGQANPDVQVFARNLTLHRPPQRIGRDQQHVKFWVTDGTETCEAIWWHCARETMPDGKFDLAFAPQINDFNGRRSVQLRVLDWRPAA
ncbi:MAG TPA: single-stranded-DNA-specific exonuclease RecJ, partial [Verrucomicrobiae bacterium]|nr:single-stranded-DNA-specific exonuclease RecJ [Verrucomicrobiae bacterium]